MFVTRGLVSKIHHMNLFVVDSNVSVICMNGHWLDSANVKLLNNHHNFNIATYYFGTWAIHGGTSILLRSNLSYVVREHF